MIAALRRISVLVGYEFRRALAKKKILALIILAVAFQTLIMVVFFQFTAGALSLGEDVKSFIWISGVLQGQGFFVQLVAIITAGGSMSEEYEHGTADILLSKPIRRTEYLLGKFTGGFLLLATVEAITTIVGVVLGTALFGPQSGLQYAPLLFLAVAYASLIFFSLSFMFSELFRRSTVAMLVSFAILFTSSIISQFIAILYLFTGNFLFFYLARAIPTWGATYFPTLLISQLVIMPGTFFVSQDPLISAEMARRGVSEAVLVGEALQQAALIIAAYAIIFTVIAVVRLVKSDVTKKTT